MFDKDDREPDEWIEALIYYLRKTFIGFVPGWGLESIIRQANAVITGENISDAINTTISPFMISPAIEKVSREAVKSLFD